MLPETRDKMSLYTTVQIDRRDILLMSIVHLRAFYRIYSADLRDPLNDLAESIVQVEPDY